MDETFFPEWTQELRAFSRDTAARLQAHEAWTQRHEHRMDAMQRQHDDQMTGLRQIMSHIATHLVEHEARISQNERMYQEISESLKAIIAKL